MVKGVTYKNGGAYIQKGASSFSISPQQHARNLQKDDKIPKVLWIISNIAYPYERSPRFIIEQKDGLLTVTREDYRDRLLPLIEMEEACYQNRLSISEWRVDTDYHGENPFSLPETLHDVYYDEVGKVTVKTGNPYKNNSWQEFYRAFRARMLGIVEAKAPIGFSYDLNDMYGVEQPGKMFYKHLSKGVDLEEATRQFDEDTLNWVLWETAKFFSRLIRVNLVIEDSDRLGNYFIEESGIVRVFRYLDLERVYQISDREKRILKVQEMFKKFINAAIKSNLLTTEKLGEFLIVSWGMRCPPILKFSEEILV